MRLSHRLTVLCAFGLAAGCTVSKPPGPAEIAAAVPYFGPIYAGNFPVINHFDHDEPRQFVDQNRYQIDWYGRRRTDEIDGHSGYDFRMPEGTTLVAPARWTSSRAWPRWCRNPACT